MNKDLSQTAQDQNLVKLLRETTSALHQSLHEHPLLVQLLQRTSNEVYRKVLYGFLMFYESAEPCLVETAYRLGVSDQYPEPIRSNWLRQDLETLGQIAPRNTKATTSIPPLELSGMGQLVGCLYVIKGSALGGRSILRELSEYSFVNDSNRFFTGDGKLTPQLWRKFQQFANQACRERSDQRAACISATRTFMRIRESLTQSMNLPPFVNRV